MELYKTSHFREIKKQKIEYVENDFFYAKLCDIYPIHHDSERIVKRPMNGSQNNYFLTEIDAKNFVLMQLSDKIRQMELHIKKYKLIANNFK